jgi:hypothetical protein
MFLRFISPPGCFPTFLPTSGAGNHRTTTDYGELMPVVQPRRRGLTRPRSPCANDNLIADLQVIADDADMKGAVLPFILLVSVGAAPPRKAPDCSGPNHWAAGIAFAQLKNAGVMTNEAVEFEHVTSKTVVSQQVGKDLWRQVFRVTFPIKSGGAIEAIVVSDASSEECSMSDGQVFLISKVL